jgi:predicted RNA binding protein YcfA (HicA-like mRNA interferase family)
LFGKKSQINFSPKPTLSALFPVKNRILKSRLSKAGFLQLSKRGKGSHSVWQHPCYPIAFIQSGKDNRDAKPYQVKTLKLVLQTIAEN